MYIYIYTYIYIYIYKTARHLQFRYISIIFGLYYILLYFRRRFVRIEI